MIIDKPIVNVTTQTISTTHEQFRVQYNTVKSNNYAVLIPPLETGATMNNSIVTLLFEVLIKLGWNVLRFDFSLARQHTNAVRKTDQEAALMDANHIVDWYTAEANPDNLLICGYASGAMLALEMLMRRPEINGFIALALNGKVDSNAFSTPCSSSGLFVHGKTDSIAPLYKVRDVIGKLQTQTNRIELQILNDDHFFKFSRKLLAKVIKEFIEEQFMPQEEIEEEYLDEYENESGERIHNDERYYQENRDQHDQHAEKNEHSTDQQIEN